MHSLVDEEGIPSMNHGLQRGLHLMSHRRGRELAVLASTLLIWGSLAVVADAASFKPYDISGMPGQSGATPGLVSLVLSVPNSSNQQLGSLELYVSPGFGLSNVSSNGALLPGSTTGAVFQNLNVQPGGASVTISFDVSAPCGTTTLTWSFVAQQSNQWQSGGSKANYLTLETVTYVNGPTTIGTAGTALNSAVTTDYDNSSCTYSLSGVPSTVAGGPNPESLTINNGPGGTLTSLTATVQSPYSITYNGSTATSATFQVNLTPSASTTVSFTLNAPCTGDGFEWSFSTNPAAFTLTSASAPITTALDTPSCSIKFIPANNGVAVADAEVASGTDSTRILTAGTPGAGLGVKVGLYDPTGTTPLAISGESVSVALTPGTATLGGTTTATTGTDGTATFTNLTVSAVGTYDLVASGSSSQVKRGTSNPFQVLSVLQPCTGRTCTVYFYPPDGNSQSSVTATGPYPGGYFEGNVNPSGLTVSCAFSPFNYADAYDTNTTWYSFTGSGSKNVSLTINKSWVQNTTNNGLSYYRVCYAAPTSFNTGVVTGFEQDGTHDGVGTYAVPILAGSALWPYDPATDPRSAGNNAMDYFGTQYYVGTLGTCNSVGNVAPCVTSTSGAGGNRTLNFVTPPGDPSYR
jgi:hypothetical protein